MSMIRSIRRNIVRNRGERWADAQKRRYGTNYCAVSHSGMRKSSRHHAPLQTFDRKSAESFSLRVAARTAIRSFMSKFTRKARDRKTQQS
jgi:hypothetical protein